MQGPLNAARGLPTLRPGVPHDWTRRYFAHRPAQPHLADLLDAGHVYPGTVVERLARSPEGLEGSLLAVQHPEPRPPARRFLLWHGRDRLVEEAFHGWFGARVQRLDTAALRLLLPKLDHFAIVDPAANPTFVLPLQGFAKLGVSVGALESILGAPVEVTAQGLWSAAGHVPSLRLYVEYDGNRYAESTRKLFYNDEGAPVTVENVARDALTRLAYDAVHPAIFRRLFSSLVGRPALHFRPDAWPSAFVAARWSPLAWAQRALDRLAAARDEGFSAVFERAHTPLANLYGEQGLGRPHIAGRFLSRARFESLLATVGDRRLHLILEGMALGYDACAADWFAWQESGGRATFCEVKSQGDHLRDTQKETILWCQRAGLDYRLLEVLHQARRAPEAETVAVKPMLPL